MQALNITVWTEPSPQCWNAVLNDYLKAIEFEQSGADPCVYIRKNTDGITIIAVYVDDLIVIASTAGDIAHVKEILAAKFKMKDMGILHYCLGITNDHNDSQQCLWLHQKQYISNILMKYKITEPKIAPTPIDPNVRLQKDDKYSKRVDIVQYQSIVGNLLYAAIATRPVIAHSVGVVSKFSSSPTEAHLTAAKWILRYLKGTASRAVKYQKSDNGTLIGYSDADWVGDPEGRYSMTGNLFLMTQGPISLLSKKQSIVALFTSEAEHVTISTVTQEAVWLRRLLMDLKALPEGPTIIMENNQGAVAFDRNPIIHTRTKHINIRYHYVQEALQEGLMTWAIVHLIRC